MGGVAVVWGGRGGAVSGSGEDWGGVGSGDDKVKGWCPIISKYSALLFQSRAVPGELFCWRTAGWLDLSVETMPS